MYVHIHTHTQSQAVGYVNNPHLPASRCQPPVEHELRAAHARGPGRGGADRAAFPQVAAEYFKNTTLLLVGVICVAAAVEKWNLHKRIALRMVMMAGAKPGM